MSTKSKVITKLQNKEYRDAFVGSQINIGLPFQIRALREQREWNQSELAKRTGMLQPRISAIESPGGSKLNIETLRRLASAFDVGLLIRFVSFSELVDWAEKFSPDTFVVPSFVEDQLSKDSLLRSKAKVASTREATPHAPVQVEILKGTTTPRGPQYAANSREVIQCQKRTNPYKLKATEKKENLMETESDLRTTSVSTQIMLR